MSRFLFATVPIIGHIAPLLSVARALTARGHDVHWYTGRKYTQRIAETGARHHPYTRARDFDDGGLDAAFPGRAEHTGLAQLRFDLKHVFADAAIPQMDDLRALCIELEPDAMIADPAMMGAVFAREHGRVPLLVLNILPCSLPSRDLAPFGLGLAPRSGTFGRLRNTLLHALCDHVLFRDVHTHWRKVRARAGLHPAVGLFHATAKADLIGLPTVPSFELPRSDMPAHVRFLGPLPAAKPAASTALDALAELDPGLPWVHVTQGTIANSKPHLLAPAIAGLAEERVQVLVATGGRPVETLGLGPLPANVHVAPFYDYGALLPRCAAMVTNGGYGGVQLALGAGVPLVVAGDTEDKPEVAARVAHAGVGVRLARAKPTAREVQRAVRRVLDEPAFKLRAQALAAEYARHDGVGAAVEAAEELARRGRAELGSRVVRLAQAS